MSWPCSGINLAFSCRTTVAAANHADMGGRSLYEVVLWIPYVNVYGTDDVHPRARRMPAMGEDERAQAEIR
jgi:hypothetical protein